MRKCCEKDKKLEKEQRSEGQKESRGMLLPYILCSRNWEKLEILGIEGLYESFCFTTRLYVTFVQLYL